MKNISYVSILVVLLCFIMLLSSCRPPNGYVDESSGSASDTKWEYTPSDPIGAFEEWTYKQIVSIYRPLQYYGDYIYFEAFPEGIYRYSLIDGSITTPCTDPFCRHKGLENTTCKIGYHLPLSFYDIHGDNIIYEGYNCNLYCFNMATMENILLDDTRDGHSYGSVTLSDKYVYIMFYEHDEKTDTTYSGYRQIEYTTGRSKDIFVTEGSSPLYRLSGAFGGKLLVTDPEITTTYIADEENPEDVKKFWEKVMGQMWVGKDAICFKSQDPEDTADRFQTEVTYYYYRMDFEGNVISKTELKNGMSFGSICDGRHLYYIPGSIKHPLYLSDGTSANTEGHRREVYCLDLDTGEEELVFTFDGDYSALNLRIGLGNGFYVADGKLILTDLSGKILGADGKISSASFKYGINIVDMETGDLTYIHANRDVDGDGKNDPICEKIEMRIGKEMTMEPDGESEAESGD